MEDKIKNYTMVTLTVALLVSLGFNVIPEASHYCESRELKAYCFSLSDTLKTCYTLPENIGGKRCSEGWEKIEGETQIVTDRTQTVTNGVTNGFCCSNEVCKTGGCQNV